MPCTLNLNAVVRYIHWAPPGDLDGLYQLAKLKMEALGLTAGKRDNILPQNVPGDPSINGRGVIQFIESVCECEPLNADDDLPENLQRKAEKKGHLEAQDKLKKLYATLSARLNAAGYKPPEPEPEPTPAPLPAPTPDPKPLA